VGLTHLCILDLMTSYSRGRRGEIERERENVFGHQRLRYYLVFLSEIEHGEKGEKFLVHPYYRIYLPADICKTSFRSPPVPPQ
jgi:hypothetical protein